MHVPEKLLLSAFDLARLTVQSSLQHSNRAMSYPPLRFRQPAVRQCQHKRVE